MQSDETIILNVAFDSLCHDFLEADDFLFIFKCTTQYQLCDRLQSKTKHLLAQGYMLVLWVGQPFI